MSGGADPGFDPVKDDNYLVRDSIYKKEYVALEDYDLKDNVIAHVKNVEEVYNEAVRKG